MSKPRASTAVDCDECGKTISRKADLARHMKTHATNKEELMHACPYVGCTYKALQRSNLATHLNVHSRERPNKCPTEGCDFSSSDPGSLTRHRKELHGYEPKSNSGSHPSAITRKEARQQRRVSPYTTSSSSSPSSSARSVSPLDPSSSNYRTLRPQLPQILDQSPPSSLLLADNNVNDSVKNTTAAYSTELITKRSQVDAPTPEPENSLPPTPELLIAPEAPMVEHPRLPVPEQGDIYAVDLPAQPVCEMTPDEVTNAVFGDFLAQFDGWHTEAVPAYTPPSLHTPLVQYTVDNTPVLTPASLPPYEVPYTVDNARVPTPASLPGHEVPYTADNTPVSTPASFPPHDVQYTVDNAPVPTPVSLPPHDVPYTVDNALHEPYGYTTEAVPFDAQFSQPYSYAAPDMGIYPQGVDRSYFYTAPAGTTGFPMQGLYVY